MEDDEEKIVSIGVKKKTRNRIEKLKIHKNQSYDEAICEILDKMVNDQVE